MGNASKRNGFYTRGFTTFLVALSFLMLLVSGIVVYATPRGRTANWTGWTFAGLGKHDWGGIHTVSALLFILIAALHIFYNWKVLLNYIRSRRSTGFRLKKELAAALLVCSVVFVGTLYDLPPFETVLAANEAIKDYWEEAGARPPVTRSALPQGEAHAGGRGLGRLTLKDYCRASGVDEAALLLALSQRGVQASAGMTVRQIAVRMQTTPREVLSLVPPVVGSAN